MLRKPDFVGHRPLFTMPWWDGQLVGHKSWDLRWVNVERETQYDLNCMCIASLDVLSEGNAMWLILNANILGYLYAAINKCCVSVLITFREKKINFLIKNFLWGEIRAFFLLNIKKILESITMRLFISSVLITTKLVPLTVYKRT